MLGLCCFTVMAASCHFLLLLAQENMLSVASVEKQILYFSVKLSPVMSAFVAVLVSQPGLGTC